MELELLRQELSQEQAALQANKMDQEVNEKKLRQRLELHNAYEQSVAQKAKKLAVSKPSPRLCSTT